MRFRLFLCAALLAANTVGARDSLPSERKDHRPITETDLFRFVWVADPQISPDGARVAFVRVAVNKKRDGYETAVWVVPADGSEAPRAFTGGPLDASPRWSPDGRLIAFAADIGGHPETYVINPDGGTPHRQAIDIADWSRDGKWVYFSSTRTGSQQLWKMRWRMKRRIPDCGPRSGGLDMERHTT